MTAFSRITSGMLLCLGFWCTLPALAQQPPTAPAAAPAAAAGAGDGRQGTFKAVQGDVTVVRANVRSAAVVAGGVQAVDRIVTGPKSAAALTLKDGTVLSIGPDSVVDLSSFVFNPTTQDGSMLVSLLRGSLRMATGLIA